jgi:hypothetical protein
MDGKPNMFIRNIVTTCILQESMNFARHPRRTIGTPTDMFVRCSADKFQTEPLPAAFFGRRQVRGRFVRLATKKNPACDGEIT